MRPEFHSRFEVKMRPLCWLIASGIFFSVASFSHGAPPDGPVGADRLANAFRSDNLSALSRLSRGKSASWLHVRVDTSAMAARVLKRQVNRPINVDRLANAFHSDNLSALSRLSGRRPPQDSK